MCERKVDNQNMKKLAEECSGNVVIGRSNSTAIFMDVNK
jgi:hypothetical protein